MKNKSSLGEEEIERIAKMVNMAMGRMINRPIIEKSLLALARKNYTKLESNSNFISADVVVFSVIIFINAIFLI